MTVVIIDLNICRATCESPDVSGDYLKAAKLWYKMHKIMDVIPYNEKYTSLVNSLEEANALGTNGGDCSQYQW